MQVEKIVITTRYWLLGAATIDRQYYKVLDALEMCLGHLNGVRNDGTAEANHSLSVFQILRTMHAHLQNPVLVYIEALLHDCIEDANQQTKKFIAPSEIQAIFGSQVHDEILIMSKMILGQPNPDFSLKRVFSNINTSVVKPADRNHNLSTMNGVFKPSRRDRYISETTDHYLPGLKVARRAFPEQEPIYENLKLAIKDKLRLLESIAKNDPTGTGLQAPVGVSQAA